MTDYLPPAIRRGRIAELTIYEISEDELQMLAKGAPESVLFNLAIFFASIAGSTAVALLTTVMSTAVFIFFIVVAVATTIAAVTLFAIWRRRHADSDAVVARIRRRLPPEGDVIQVTPLPPIALESTTATEVLPSDTKGTEAPEA